MARYTQEEYKRAREVNIVDFLSSQGYELVSRGSHDYELKKYDSLKISKDGRKWVWHSHGTGGTSPIELYKELKNRENEPINTIEAIKTLAAFNGGYISSNLSPSQAVPATEEKKPFELPERWTDNKRAYAYLTKARGLDEDIVDDCFDRGLIYESKKFHNVVFVGQKDEGGAA